MKYPYWKITPENASDPWIRRPLVPITLEGPARTMKFAALVDSGADHSLFHTDVAKALGIDLGACEKQAVAGIEGVPAQSYVTEKKAIPLLRGGSLFSLVHDVERVELIVVLIVCRWRRKPAERWRRAF